MAKPPITDIIFLGAGASRSDGAPLQGELFEQFFKKKEKDDEYSIQKFFKDFFDIDVNDNQKNLYPTFEEVLGILELAISRNESFINYQLTPRNPRCQQIREGLILLIAKILSQKLKGKREGYHHKLINKLISKERILQTCFISLNYDILIDNALTEKYPDYHLDYGVDFTNFERKNDWEKPDPDKSVLLLKLHGSLNWLYCQTCISLSLTQKRNDAATTIIKPHNCIECKTPQVPIIIPPSYFKIMSNIYLQEVWKKTNSILMNADRIFFCGYSFPDADLHLKYLLKRSQVNRKKQFEISIFNNYPNKPKEELESEETRYSRFFGKKANINYIKKSFEEFVESYL